MNFGQVEFAFKKCIYSFIFVLAVAHVMQPMSFTQNRSSLTSFHLHLFFFNLLSLGKNCYQFGMFFLFFFFFGLHLLTRVCTDTCVKFWVKLLPMWHIVPLQQLNFLCLKMGLGTFSLLISRHLPYLVYLLCKFQNMLQSHNM